MATSSFIRKIVLGEEAVDKMVQMINEEETKDSTSTVEYSLNDEEFMEKCLGLSTCKK